jgi:hypothetical protein
VRIDRVGMPVRIAEALTGEGLKTFLGAGVGDVHRDEERLVARQPLHRHLPLWLILKIEIGVAYP